MTQVLQTTASAARQTSAEPHANVMENNEFCRGSDPAVADWITAVNSQGTPEHRPEPIADPGITGADAGRTAAPGNRNGPRRA